MLDRHEERVHPVHGNAFEFNNKVIISMYIIVLSVKYITIILVVINLQSQ